MDARKLITIFSEIHQDLKQHRLKDMKYLKPSEVSERWQGSISTGTLANWRVKGKGPAFVKFGSKVLYPIDALERWEAKSLAALNDNTEYIPGKIAS